MGENPGTAPHCRETMHRIAEPTPFGPTGLELRAGAIDDFSGTLAWIDGTETTIRMTLLDDPYLSDRRFAHQMEGDRCQEEVHLEIDYQLSTEDGRLDERVNGHVVLTAPGTGTLFSSIEEGALAGGLRLREFFPQADCSDGDGAGGEYRCSSGVINLEITLTPDGTVGELVVIPRWQDESEPPAHW